MLFGSMAESNKSNNVIIHDLTEKQFEWLKKYVYQQNPKITRKNVISIIQMSDKYMIHSLSCSCGKFLVQMQDCNAFARIISQLYQCHMTSIINGVFAVYSDATKVLAVLESKYLVQWEPKLVYQCIDKSKIMQKKNNCIEINRVFKRL